ncbi:MAG: ATP-binding protein, partial [Halobacteriales archaeon]|nr:ATP-binding protein [Halobacteriales archaeon]
LSRIGAATDRLGTDLDAALDIPAAPAEEIDAVRTTLLHLQEQLRRARSARIAEASQREALERQLHEADKLIVVGQLAAGVAHEIGSPLQVLIGRARLLTSSSSLTPEGQRQTGLIVEHAERIVAIVDRLQDVVRRRPSRPRRVDLAQPVDKVIWLVEPEARRREVDLRWTPPPHAIWVHADPDEVQQVVLNLALNALQATPAGGRVDIQVTADGSLVVHDTGRGMNDSTRARAFEPFFTTRPEEGGTGLGLSVVKSIVDRHRGRIHIESAVGTGTEVRVDWEREQA